MNRIANLEKKSWNECVLMQQRGSNFSVAENKDFQKSYQEPHSWINLHPLSYQDCQQTT